jgi:hypothetical protein
VDFLNGKLILHCMCPFRLTRCDLSLADMESLQERQENELQALKVRI